MQLDEFFNYKNQLMNDLMTSEQIVCLLNDSEEVRCDPERLVYSQVFPYEYVPDTVAHGQTFICCDVDIQRVESKTFLRPTLYIWVFTHKSKMRLLEFMSSRRFAPITDYQGKVLTFQARDFNRLSPSGRSAPSNRRSG